jgi:hypothetical protein
LEDDKPSIHLEIPTSGIRLMIFALLLNFFSSRTLAMCGRFLANFMRSSIVIQPLDKSKDMLEI